MTSPAEAAAIAGHLLAEALPRRWRHTQGVAATARSLRHLAGEDGDRLEAAAWLHDIGYSPAIAVTGFHPLDGARALPSFGVDDPLVIALVANHTGASFEAEERGLQRELESECPTSRLKGSDLLAVLTYCDLTTGTAGEPETVDGRFAEILVRHSSSSSVFRAITRSEPLLRDTAHTVETRLRTP